MAAPNREYHQLVKELRVFDARCWLGPTVTPQLPGEPRAHSANELLSLLDRAGIERAVVFHTLAAHGDAVQGNQAVIQELNGRPRLIPGAVVLPETMSGDGLRGLIQRGVRLAAVYPASHGFSLGPWCCGELLSALAVHRLPLVIPHTEAPWGAIRRVCLDHPNLPVLVEGGRAKLIYENRVFYPLLRECPNLHLVLHALIGWRMVDDLVSQFGAERLICGSHLPLQDPNVMLGTLLWSEMSGAAKSGIAHSNLEALIAGVQP